MVLIRASLVARPRICWAITLVDAFFRFCRRLIGALAFHGDNRGLCRVPLGVFSAAAWRARRKR